MASSAISYPTTSRMFHILSTSKSVYQNDTPLISERSVYARLCLRTNNTESCSHYYIFTDSVSQTACLSKRSRAICYVLLDLQFLLQYNLHLFYDSQFKHTTNIIIDNNILITFYFGYKIWNMFVPYFYVKRSLP